MSWGAGGWLPGGKKTFIWLTRFFFLLLLVDDDVLEKEEKSEKQMCAVVYCVTN